jgi:hypothetical protein
MRVIHSSRHLAKSPPGGVKLKGTYKSDPSPPPPAPDPDAQLRCYKRVADDAHFYDSSNKVLHQQLLLCGPQKH